MMRRALIWLNPYGHGAVRHKLKNCLKTQKMHFLPVFELMSDSLTAIWVEPNQCPSHHSILRTQGPIHEILAEIAQLLAMLKNSLFNIMMVLQPKTRAGIIKLHERIYSNQVFSPFRFFANSNYVPIFCCYCLHTYMIVTNLDIGQMMLLFFNLFILRIKVS